jgi:hypothetical protein
MSKITLATIQAKIKAPKGQFNKFGNYKYRSAEDIVEAVKPVINELGYYLILTDYVKIVGDRIYIEATATLSDGETTYQATGYAREEETKKGMDSSQITGAASSYARKYALNGLFAIDDTKDSDATNTHDDKPVKKEPAKEVKAEPVKAEPANYSESNYNEIKDLLEKIVTIGELVTLYNQHKAEIDNDVKLRKSMTERKQFILRQIEQEAKK